MFVASSFFFFFAFYTRMHTNDQERICELVRQICGIGLGNQWTPPGMFTACMAIAACRSCFPVVFDTVTNSPVGDRFQERADQEALLDMLRRTDKDHGRPTEAVQRQLMQSWDWLV